MFSKILVTGASGFVGRHLLPILKDRYGASAVIGVSSRDFDLMDSIQHRTMFAKIRPEVLVHLAAYSGGIGASPRVRYHINTEKVARIARVPNSRQTVYDFVDAYSPVEGAR